MDCPARHIKTVTIDDPHHYCPGQHPAWFPCGPVHGFRVDHQRLNEPTHSGSRSNNYGYGMQSLLSSSTAPGHGGQLIFIPHSESVAYLLVHTPAAKKRQRKSARAGVALDHYATLFGLLTTNRAQDIIQSSRVDTPKPQILVAHDDPAQSLSFCHFKHDRRAPALRPLPHDGMIWHSCQELRSRRVDPR